MTVQESGMTVDQVVASEPSLVRFTTPYLEVERLSISLERTVPRELAQVSRATRSKRKSSDQPSHRVA